MDVLPLHAQQTIVRFLKAVRHVQMLDGNRRWIEVKNLNYFSTFGSCSVGHALIEGLLRICHDELKREVIFMNASNRIVRCYLPWESVFIFLYLYDLHSNSKSMLYLSCKQVSNSFMFITL